MHVGKRMFCYGLFKHTHAPSSPSPALRAWQAATDSASQTAACVSRAHSISSALASHGQTYATPIVAPSCCAGSKPWATPMTCKRIAPAKWPGQCAPLATPSDLQGLFLVMAMTRCLTGMDEAVMHAQRKVATACDCWIRPRARSARLPARPDEPARQGQ